MTTGQHPRIRETERDAVRRVSGIKRRELDQAEKVYVPNRADRRMRMNSIPQEIRRQVLPGWITFRESILEKLRS